MSARKQGHIINITASIASQPLGIKLAFDDEISAIRLRPTSGFMAKVLQLAILNPSKLATYSTAQGDTVLWDNLSTTDVVETRDDAALARVLADGREVAQDCGLEVGTYDVLDEAIAVAAERAGAVGPAYRRERSHVEGEGRSGGAEKAAAGASTAARRAGTWDGATRCVPRRLPGRERGTAARAAPEAARA